MKKRLLFNTSTSLLMQVVAVICGFVLPRLILERYGSETNGLIQSISQFLGMISLLEMGVGQVIQSSLYKPLAQGDTDRISTIIKSGSQYFRKIAYALMLYIAVLVLLFPYITDNSYEWQYTAVLIVAMSIGSFAQYYFGIIDKILLSSDQRGYVQYTVQIITTLLNTVVSVVLILLGCSILVVKTCAAFVFLLNPLIIRWYISKNYRINRKIQYQGEPIKQKWNGVAQHIAAVVVEGTDNVVLTLFSTLSNVSVYSTYFLVIGGIKQLYMALVVGVQSIVGELWAKQERNKLYTAFQKIEILLHSLAVFLFSCVAVLIVPFVKVYTDGLTDAEYIQPLFAGILTLAYGIRYLRTSYNILILAGGHYKQTQVCHIVTALLNIIISIIAVWFFGLVGIAMGTLVAFTYQTLWMMVYSSKHLLKWPLRNAIKQLLVDILTVLSILGATCWIELGEVSYWGWLRMAIPVALIALAITVIIAVLFNGVVIMDLLRQRMRRKT